MFRVSALIFALVLLTAGSARAAEPRLGEFVFDGQVRSIARGPDGSLYVGGDFSRELKPTGGGLVLAGNGSGTPDSSSFPLVQGAVYAVTPDGAGGWYVGGQFARVGNLDVRNLAHVTAFGTADPGFTPNPDDVVYALTRSGGTLYAGGDFTSIGGQSRNRLAALDAASGAATPWAGGANAVVFSLAVSGQTLYAGGNFTSVGSQARDGIVALDATTGAVKTGWNSQSTGAARSIAIVGSKVYVAGSVFRFPGGVEHRWLAALDATTGAVQSWDPQIGYVRGIAASGTMLFAVGDFRNVGASSQSYAASFDTVSGLKTNWDPQVEWAGGVVTVAVSGTTVYLGGSINRVHGQDRRNLAAVDASTGTLLSWNPQAAGQVNALATQGTSVYAGGTFAGAGPSVGDAYGVARIRPDGTLDTGWKTGVDSGVTAVLVSGSTVYLAGFFTHVGSAPRNGFASVSAVTGGVTAWDPKADIGDGTGAYGSALASDGATLYAAGNFNYVDGNGRRGLAAFEMTSGVLVGGDANTVGYVNALATSGSTLFIGGSFPQVAGKPRSGLAALEGFGTSLRPWDASVGFNESVNAIAMDGQTAYIAGAFTYVGGKVRRGIGAVDTTTGAANAWDPSSNATAMYSAAVAGTTVFAGGDFTVIGGRQRRYLAALDTTTGAATAWNGAPDDVPAVLFSDGTNVYAGGTFVSIGKRLTGPFAKLDLTAPDTTLGTVSGDAIAFSADEPDVTYECARDGAAFAPCSSPAPLNGARAFEVRATDLSNNTDATPARFTNTVTPLDTVTPQPVVVPSPSPAPQPAKPTTPAKKKTPSHIVTIPFKGGYRIGSLPRARACNGKITLELRKGKRVLERRATKLDKRCRYTTTFKVKRTTLGKATQLTVVVRFHGNRYLGRTTNRFPVSVPK